jgi:hypothetical protein
VNSVYSVKKSQNINEFKFQWTMIGLGAGFEESEDFDLRARGENRGLGFSPGWDGD